MPSSATVRRPDADPDVALLRRLGLSAAQCKNVMARAAALNVGPEAVAIAWRLVDEEAFYRELARSLALPFLARPFPVDPHGVSPHGAAAGITRRADGRIVAAPRGAALRRFLADRPPGCLLTSPGILRESLRQAWRNSAAFAAAAALLVETPEQTARRDGAAGGFVAASWLVALVVLAFGDPLFALPVTLPLGLIFAWTVGHRIMAIAMARAARRQKAPPALTPRELPFYSVLVPLYREADMVPRLVGALAALDYPQEKLEILFLVEEHDRPTRDALARLPLEPQMRIVPCPDGAPRTKPRALNFGLQESSGEFIAVYDAEDAPEPDQLAKAAALFRRLPPDVACLQAELAIAQGDLNFWTRGFALEYAALFQIIMPGLCGLGLPVALGGTSNHFRRDVLLELKGWDAWNVTEDADLGLRLALEGYRVAHLPSRTWEDAPSDGRAWRQQRIRWIKGWMQTSLVHLRSNRQGWRTLSLSEKFGVLHHLVGTPVSAFLTPLFSIALAAGLLSGEWSLVHQGTMALGTALAMAAALATCALLLQARPTLSPSARRRALIAFPGYLLLVCGCAWLALAELVRAPFRWNKTPHEASEPQGPAAPSPERRKRRRIPADVAVSAACIGNARTGRAR